MKAHEHKPTVALIVPYAPAVPLFRRPLLQELAGRGFTSLVYAPDWTEALEKALEQERGVRALHYPLKRTSISPLADLKTLLSLAVSLAHSQPHLVLTFQPKPNIYGILAAALARVPRRYAVVEGLGFAFTPGKEGLRQKLVRAALGGLYRISFFLAQFKPQRPQRVCFHGSGALGKGFSSMKAIRNLICESFI